MIRSYNIQSRSFKLKNSTSYTAGIVVAAASSVGYVDTATDGDFPAGVLRYSAARGKVGRLADVITDGTVQLVASESISAITDSVPTYVVCASGGKVANIPAAGSASISVWTVGRVDLSQGNIPRDDSGLIVIDRRLIEIAAVQV